MNKLICLFLVLITIFSLSSCTNKKAATVLPSDTTAPAVNTPPATTESTPPPTTEAPPPPPEDDRVLMIREVSGCGHLHNRVFRNSVDHKLVDFSSLTEAPTDIDNELLNELLLLKLNDVYMKEYSGKTVVSAKVMQSYEWNFEDVRYLLLTNIRLTLNDGNYESSGNLMLLVPVSMVTLD